MDEREKKGRNSLTLQGIGAASDEAPSERTHPKTISTKPPPATTLRPPTKGPSEIVLSPRGRSNRPRNPMDRRARVNSSSSPPPGHSSSQPPRRSEPPGRRPSLEALTQDVKLAAHEDLGVDDTRPVSYTGQTPATPAKAGPSEPLPSKPVPAKQYSDPAKPVRESARPIIAPTPQAAPTPESGRPTLLLGVFAVALVASVVGWAIWQAQDHDTDGAVVGNDPTQEPSGGDPANTVGVANPQQVETGGTPTTRPPEIPTQPAVAGGTGTPTAAPASGTFVIQDPEIPMEIRRLGPWPRRHQAQQLRAQARSEFARRAYARAEETFRQSLLHDPESHDAAAGLTRALTQQGRFVEATAWARRAVEQEPREPRYRELLGDLLLDQEDLAGALTQYQAGLSSNPGDTRLSSRIRRLADH